MQVSGKKALLSFTEQRWIKATQNPKGFVSKSPKPSGVIAFSLEPDFRVCPCLHKGQFHHMDVKQWRSWAQFELKALYEAVAFVCRCFKSV
jgi:hypothetical protein